LTQAEFEQVAEEAYDTLPEKLKARIENVRIVVEELPDEPVIRKVGLQSPYELLGLYQGIPLSARNTGYGTFPVVPDTITLYKYNIEKAASFGSSVREKIQEVLVHEIAHYFGMNEEEIRRAGY
jgi:predicted Zn-dependent protease with MMP-like domain